MGCATSHDANDSVDWKPQSEFRENYRMGDVLGRGAFGQVLEASNIKNGSSCAVKVLTTSIKRDPEASQRAREDAENEALIWQKVGVHEHCVELMEVFKGPTLCLMTMEKCGGSFLQQLLSLPKAGEENLRQAFQQLLLGVAHIHKQRIVHRDIKVDNFLWGMDGKAKLCDFGLAALLPKKGLLKGTYGTPPYMSPEMVLGKGHDENTDMWSVGASLYLILYGDFPYVPHEQNATAMKQCIKDGSTMPTFVPVQATFGKPSQGAEAFVRCLLSRAVTVRASATKALEHSFIATAIENVPCKLLTLVKSKSKEFPSTKGRIDPTVQRDIEELLSKLQPAHGGGRLRRSFTDNLELADAAVPELGHKVSEQPDLDRSLSAVSRRSSRSSTHTGSISIPSSALKEAGGDAEDDLISTDASDSSAAARRAATKSIENMANFHDEDVPSDDTWASGAKQRLVL